MRDQKMGQDNILALRVIPNRPIMLEWWVGHDVAQDRWELHSNGHLLATTTAETGCTPIYYLRTIPTEWVTSERLEVIFRNTSTDSDGAGLWGLIYR